MTRFTHALSTTVIVSVVLGITSREPVRAATTSVTSTADSGPGSLRDAIANAASGDTVNFELTGCPCTITLTTGEIALDRDVTIAGPGAEVLTVSGNHASRVFRVSAGVTGRISGMTLTDGAVSYIGGAVLNLGTLHLTDSTVSGSTATSALSQGGGIYNNSILVVTRSTIAGNAATDGGGIFSNGDLYVTLSTISGNTAYFGYGGGIYLSNRIRWARLYNSTIVENVGIGPGNGVHRADTPFTTLVAIRNTIIAKSAGNAGVFVYSDAFGQIHSEGYNLIGIADGTTGDTKPTDQKGTSAAPLDPRLGPLQDNGGHTSTHELLDGSPALDQAGASFDPFTFGQINFDQRGRSLPVDDPAIPNAVDSNGGDIGAVEHHAPGLDTTPPIITPTISGTPGANGWYVSDVQLSWSVVDGESDVTILNGCQTYMFSDDTGDLFLSCSAASDGGVSGESAGFRRDATPPTLAPTVLPNPVMQNAAATATPNAADNLSGLSSQGCEAVDTSIVGTHTLICYATDNAGTTATATATYQVVAPSLAFVGFFQPVDNLPTLNVATAGSAIPVKFSLTGYQGLEIFAAGYPASSPVACDTNEPGAAIEESVTAGGSSLSYAAGSDQYSYVWKTDKAWKNSCRILVVKFTDGSQHFAKFRFR
jgi:hypothetical protein